MSCNKHSDHQGALNVHKPFLRSSILLFFVIVANINWVFSQTRVFNFHLKLLASCEGLLKDHNYPGPGGGVHPPPSVSCDLFNQEVHSSPVHSQDVIDVVCLCLYYISYAVPFHFTPYLTRSLKLLLKSPSSPLSTNVLALVSYSGLLWLSGKWFILWVSSFNYSPRCVGLAACFCQLANQQVNLTQLVVGWAEPQTKNKLFTGCGGRHTQNY